MLVERAMKGDRQSGDASEKGVEGMEEGINSITEEQYRQNISLA